jgi:hypothetical protein
MQISGVATMATPIEQKIDNNLKVGNFCSNEFKVILDVLIFGSLYLHVQGHSST